MANAKEEFLEETAEEEIKCATIRHYSRGESLLKIDYTDAELNRFLDSLNYTYDNGFGGQELYGTIWYKDGTWSDRGEYDGSERWVYNSVPCIPPELLK